MNYRSFSDLSSLVMENLYKIPHDIDLVVGIPRSGLLVANIIALIMNKPLTDIEGLKENRLISSGKTKNTDAHKARIDACKKILIVDDSINAGVAIKEVKKEIEKIGLDQRVLYLVAYSTKDSAYLADIVLEILQTPRLFEWNIFHHKYIEKSCFDMDGVLCADPSSEENDDGEKYLNFIINAAPKIIPTRKIGAIVTSRLEKYRAETEAWLHRNNIEYGELIMLNTTAEKRREFGLHKSFKTEFYKKSNYILFVESENTQAIFINEISKKPVFCVDNNQFYDLAGVYKVKETIKNSIIVSRLHKSLVYLRTKRALHNNT